MEDALLNWYEKNQRCLPWRAKKGEKPNPYFVYLSEIFLQQTTVATVIDYFNRFINRWPTLEDLAKASEHEVLTEFQGLGYYSRARNLEKCVKKFVNDGCIPTTFKRLLDYPGIGDYTAKAVAAIAFNESVIPIDGNVIRVFSRYFGLKNLLPSLKKDVLEKTFEFAILKNPGDFAQSLMDLGSMICKPQNPLCDICPLKSSCVAKRQNLQNVLPLKAQKIKKPKKIGTAFIFHTKDAILLEKNETERLLKNLWGVPTSPWIEVESLLKEKDSIIHVFTHFTLQLNIQSEEIKSVQNFKLKENQVFVLKKNLKNYPLSTLMKKVLNKGHIMLEDITDIK
ncbi:MAG: A/G-specific adenine glycosylase [Proteobacteria bacterium]|nr:A/G-specific adenine glycosylase [Pseudomonadota bacterium]